ncbi:MAG: hypothetical protein A2W99_04265 [Bacteroidetes bacterium GWF2_33_16]|nr:MAG: hypothetical protein A2X00_16785 [Bacteroidetes bacterium GWE2_32_14]OFY05886.1 MAG: hypothetical protein A2W99_04265 [Bacteroidetes bacterium GWF2_33_16]
MRLLNGFVVLLFVSGIFLSCTINSNENKLNNTVNHKSYSGIPDMEFDTLFHDFGDIIEGEKVAVTFRFKNTGDSELLILDAFSTCGCTVPNYNKEPILPGKEGKIEILFDSHNRAGLQNKAITLKINTPLGEKTLWIKANVKSNYN